MFLTSVNSLILDPETLCKRCEVLSFYQCFSKFSTDSAMGEFSCHCSFAHTLQSDLLPVSFILGNLFPCQLLAINCFYLKKTALIMELK